MSNRPTHWANVWCVATHHPPPRLGAHSPLKTALASPVPMVPVLRGRSRVHQGASPVIDDRATGGRLTPSSIPREPLHVNWSNLKALRVTRSGPARRPGAPSRARGVFSPHCNFRLCVWCACRCTYAQEICASTAMIHQFFTAGKTVPIARGGGYNQVGTDGHIPA